MFIFIGVLQSRRPTTLSETEINRGIMEGNSKNISSNIIDLGDDDNEPSKVSSSKIVVEIKGEVTKPDVYELEAESRINDLINLAGGITENGDIESINRAEILNDGDCIIIKNIKDKNEESEEEKENLSFNNNNSLKNENRKININSAKKEELMTLTGIGETKASSIIEYRSKNGKFASIEQLAEVNGIGIKTVEKLKDKITIK